MSNPIEVLIDEAIQHVRNVDPVWEKSQPPEFKIIVVEAWKKRIASCLKTNSLISWELLVGKKTFSCSAPLFYIIDWKYNPYRKGAVKCFDVR